MSEGYETFFSSDLWKSALEKFATVTSLTVQLYGLDEPVPWGPVHPTPLFQLFAGAGWDPGLFTRCASRCLAPVEGRPVVTVEQAHGLAAVGTSLVLGGEIVGAAVGGYAFVDFNQAPGLQRLARDAGLPFQRLWEMARRQQPVPQRRLIQSGELLQVLGDALLRENERTRQCEETADRLTVASAAKDEFMAVLSHELRSPLTPILGWSRLLQLGDEQPQVAKAASAIERNALLQLRLIEDLLDLNRIGLDKVALDLKVYDLWDVLSSALETIAQDAETKGVRLETESGEPLLIRGDGGRLQQVFRNVLSNALKFTPAGGSIRVRAEEAAGEAVVHVRDSGEGITPDFLPFVFDMFRQQEDGTLRKHSGLGVGLALVKRLIELHHGTISVASQGEGCGTEVTVRLPLVAGAAADASSSSENGVYRSFEGLSILIVEDMADTRETLRVLLERFGAKVLLAEDGKEALGIVANIPTDLVLCDLRMPRMDGFDFIRALHRIPERAELPVIALSGLVTEADRERTRAAGFEGHVCKPFDNAVLVEAVRSTLAFRRQA